MDGAKGLARNAALQAPDPGRLGRFRTALREGGYRGEIAEDEATRTVLATDNSIYEMTPALVLFPREAEDLNRILRAAGASRVPVVPRGGGTGTNGQSLTRAVAVDCSRYLTRIERIDPEARLAVVQPGVILDSLNRAAAEHGLMFAPTVSTASRATLGGMAATDASGKGSRVHGRTSDHVAAIEVALTDGSTWTARAAGTEDADGGPYGGPDAAAPPLAGRILERLSRVAAAEREEIARVYPAMNRGLTGYNLRDMDRGAGAAPDPVKLLCGSEGTLALTRRLVVRLVPRPACRALLVSAHDDALAALADVPRLTAADPVAVEFIDDRIVGLARDEPAWHRLASALESGPADRPVRGLTFTEFQADSPAALTKALARLDTLPAAPASLVAGRLVTDPDTIAELWSLRARCVGLLGRMDPTRQGTAFVEDAAVPPERLAAFVAGFCRILDRHGLAYGMFGHADVGCVHVRPALDLRRPGDAALIRPISDAVARLAKENGGLIWGEHGKGVRGEYGPLVVGARLYRAFCEVKASFDPDNLLNPGKIAAPDPQLPLLRIDDVPFRGTMDAAIPAAALTGFDRAVACNGNGQCFSMDAAEAMCPSYQATGDRRLSPKGRAAQIRAWLRAGSGPVDPQLRESLDACLGCKACASSCPVHVDIPAMRSRLRAAHHARAPRPPHHHLLALQEPAAPLMRAFPGTSRAALRLFAPLISRAGLLDLPACRPVPRARKRAQGRAVLLAQDSLLATFDGTVIEAAETVLSALGYAPRRLAPRANGKALHVLGMERRFARIARRQVAWVRRQAGRGIPIVGLEPVVISLWRDEYRDHGAQGNEVTSIDAFLAAEIAAGRLPCRPGARGTAAPCTLLLHCSESAADPSAATRWKEIFAHLGLPLRYRRTGCCGMAGSFGHERQNAALARKVFDLSWNGALSEAGTGAMATGFSCRCQAERCAGRRPPHPLEVLATALTV